MRNSKIIAKISAFSALWVITPALAFAAIADVCTLLNQLFTPVKVLGNVILILAIAMILWSGFLFLTAGGNEDTLKKAKSVLIYALIGIAVAFLATSARFIVGAILPGASLQTQCQTGA